MSRCVHACSVARGTGFTWQHEHLSPPVNHNFGVEVSFGSWTEDHVMKEDYAAFCEAAECSSHSSGILCQVRRMCWRRHVQSDAVCEIEASKVPHHLALEMLRKQNEKVLGMPNNVRRQIVDEDFTIKLSSERGACSRVAHAVGRNLKSNWWC